MNMCLANLSQCPYQSSPECNDPADLGSGVFTSWYRRFHPATIYASEPERFHLFGCQKTQPGLPPGGDQVHPPCADATVVAEPASPMWR